MDKDKDLDVFSGYFTETAIPVTELLQEFYGDRLEDVEVIEK